MRTVEELLSEDAGEPVEDIEGMQSPAGEGAPPWYLAPSPETPINEYIDHPMNFLNSEGLAQVIRGMEGMLGTLNYAMVDIGVGALRYYWDVKKVDKS